MKLFNYWRSSASYRVRLALHFKTLSFEYVPVSLLKGEQHQPEHRHRNPAGYVPVLEVDEGGQRVLLTQSFAIFEYLEERFPEKPLLPSRPVERAQVRAMAELVNSGIQPFHNLDTLAYVKQLGLDATQWAPRWIDLGLDALEKLASRTAGRFMFGDTFTWADCCLLPQMYGARRFGGDVNRYPLLVRLEQNSLDLAFVQAAKPEAQVDAQPAPVP
jgi:maleylpyruvate isomerase